jgi:hypothetical protein
MESNSSNKPQRKKKTVQLDLETTERLDKLGTRGNTYNSVIGGLLNFFNTESERFTSIIERIIYDMLVQADQDYDWKDKLEEIRKEKNLTFEDDLEYKGAIKVLTDQLIEEMRKGSAVSLGGVDLSHKQVEWWELRGAVDG